MSKSVNFKSFKNHTYSIGVSKVKQIFWYFFSACLFKSSFPWYAPKIFFLKLFGAKIGKGLVIKPHVTIKYPWKLTIGNYCWIGEQVWIDNLSEVTMGSNVCISQGAMLLCGNHNYKKTTFDLETKPIKLEDGVWIGAKAIVTGGTICESHSVLSVQSVASSNLKKFGIYRGNPAEWVKQREIN